jgi:photosystem II stability/assembly factor-like uncharacterized protein
VFGSSENGWIYGGDFFETHDGGANWKQVVFDRAAQVNELSTLGDNVWAIESRFGCLGSTKCAPQILRISTDGGRTWRRRTMPVMGDVGMQLVRQSVTHAWLLVQGESDTGIFETSDAGRSWKRKSSPCGTTFASTMARRGTNTLYLVCGSEPGAGEQIKVAFRSVDGAARWAKINGKLPIGGYVVSLMATSKALWLGLARERPQQSTNNGATWISAAIDPPDDFAGFGNLHFIDDRAGWVTNYGAIYRTVDGYTWKSFLLNRTFPGTMATP